MSPYPKTEQLFVLASVFRWIDNHARWLQRLGWSALSVVVLSIRTGAPDVQHFLPWQPTWGDACESGHWSYSSPRLTVRHYRGSHLFLLLCAILVFGSGSPRRGRSGVGSQYRATPVGNTARIQRLDPGDGRWPDAESAGVP